MEPRVHLLSTHRPGADRSCFFRVLLWRIAGALTTQRASPFPYAHPRHTTCRSRPRARTSSPTCLLPTWCNAGASLIYPQQMSSSTTTAPNTPEHAASHALHPGVRRVHTLPTKLVDPSRSSPTAASPSADSVETLFVHPSAKVVSFTTATPRPGSSSGRRASTDDSGGSTGTLSWMSPSERTLAAGASPFRTCPTGKPLTLA
jgi:hypothetical protein